MIASIYLFLNLIFMKKGKVNLQVLLLKISYRIQLTNFKHKV